MFFLSVHLYVTNNLFGISMFMAWGLGIVVARVWITVNDTGCGFDDFIFSFTCSGNKTKCSKGCIVLRHSVHHFPPNSGFTTFYVTELKNALPRLQSEEIIMLNILFPRIGIELTTYFTVTRLCHCATTGLEINKKKLIYIYIYIYSEYMYKAGSNIKH